MRTKAKTSVALTAETRALLARLADKLGVSRSAALDHAIRLAATRGGEVMETSAEWAKRVRAESDARKADPVTRQADEEWMAAWLAGLPHLPRPDEGATVVVFYKKSPNRPKANSA